MLQYILMHIWRRRAHKARNDHSHQPMTLLPTMAAQTVTSAQFTENGVCKAVVVITRRYGQSIGRSSMGDWSFQMPSVPLARLIESRHSFC